MSLSAPLYFSAQMCFPVAALTAAEQIERAKEEAAEIVRIRPDASKTAARATLPFTPAPHTDRFFDDLRQAGLPE